MVTPESRPTEQHRQQRMELAIVFLNRVLIPFLDTLAPEETISAEQLTSLETAFKHQYQILGNDFTLDHVWATAWVTVKNAQDNAEDITPEQLAKTKRAWKNLSVIQTK